MASVELTFTPVPAHVRTARLIAIAVARRAGIPEALLDEVRLAVGEACSRAVEAHLEHCPRSPVRLVLSDDDGRFEAVVTDDAPGEAGPPAGVNGDGYDPMSANLGLAVIAGLADDVDVSPSDTGMRVRMSWPLTRTERAAG